MRIHVLTRRPRVKWECGKAGDRCPGGGGGRDGRLRIAALSNVKMQTMAGQIYFASVRTHIRKKHVKTSHHTVWSHNFQKMDVCSHRNIVSSHHQHLITPKKNCSHHQFSRSHRHNFDHTIKMLITLLKTCFTPSKFWSHHLFLGSHLHNFVHTIKMLFTLLKSCFTPSKFWSHHQFSRSHRHNFHHTIKMLFTLLKICFTPFKFWSHHLNCIHTQN